MAATIPGGDAEFNAWLENFVTYANGHLAELGLVAGDLTPVTTAQTAWAGGLAALGITVVEQLPIEIKPNEHNMKYLRTKKQKMGHLLEEV